MGQSQKRFIFTVILATFIIIACFALFANLPRITGHITGSAIANSNIGGINPEGLAKCLTEKNAKLYGAYWCPHCQNQKDIFGESANILNYIECDSSGENPKPEECEKAGIAGYPTWVINGKSYEGEQSLSKLKQLSGC